MSGRVMGFLDGQRRGQPVGAWFDDDHVTRVLLAGAIFMFASFVVVIPAWLMDVRTLDGVGVWVKPQKFHLSLGVHFLTLAFLAQQLPRAIRSGPTLSVFSYLALGALMLESVYIMIQAARGRRSHFNYETQFENLMYALMGLGALLLVFVAIALAVQLWRKGQTSLPGYRLGSILGLFFGAVATIGLAGYMSMSGSHWVGDHPAGGAAIPFFGWSREVGDLRPSHFVTLHMMQTLPLIGFLADRLRLPYAIALWVVTGVQLALAAFLFMQALEGRPFLPA